MLKYLVIFVVGGVTLLLLSGAYARTSAEVRSGVVRFPLLKPYKWFFTLGALALAALATFLVGVGIDEGWVFVAAAAALPLLPPGDIWMNRRGVHQRRFFFTKAFRKDIPWDAFDEVLVDRGRRNPDGIPKAAITDKRTGTRIRHRAYHADYERFIEELRARGKRIVDPGAQRAPQAE